MLLALRGSFAIIPEPARPELGEHIIGRTAREALNRTVLLPLLNQPAVSPLRDAVGWAGRSYFAAAAMRGQSAICTRAMSTYLPPSGRKIEASPSFTSNQSLPSASMMFGLCVIRTVLVPAFGAADSSMRNAAARHLLSLGDTTRPPSCNSAVLSMPVKPAVLA